jgi:hypothetical protein
MTKEEIKSAIEKAKKQATFAVEQDEKDFVAKKISKLEKELADMEAAEKPKEEPKAEPKEEPKAEPKEEPKAEPKPKAKAAPKKAAPKKAAPKKAEPKAAPKPKKGEPGCEELEEEVKKVTGYDIDEVLERAKASKARAKEAAEKRKDAPKKTPATKNKEAIVKTTEKVVTNVEKRAEKSEVTKEEIEKLISQYEDAINELRKVLTKLAGKKAQGGRAEGSFINPLNPDFKFPGTNIKDFGTGIEFKKGGKAPKPHMVRSQFEEEEFEYAKGGDLLYEGHL